ncbi:hypothetical protein FHW92_001090 [Novosphingobium sp. SG707]|nr:hypothetical protein [Novosphingobium sp. SG707]
MDARDSSLALPLLYMLRAGFGVLCRTHRLEF